MPVTHDTLRRIAVFVATRLALAVAMFFVVSLAVFVLMFDVGNVFDQGNPFDESPPDYVAEGSSVERWDDWLADAARFEFGRNLLTDRPTADIIRERWRVTTEVTVTATLISVALAFGALRLKSGGAGRAVAGALTALLASIPFFAVLFFVLVLPSDWWDYVPPLGRRTSLFDEPWDHIRLLGPPALILGILGAGPAIVAVTSRFREARPSGTVLAIAAAGALPWILGAMVVVEPMFNLRGLGYFMLETAITANSSGFAATFILFAFAGIGLRLCLPVALASSPASDFAVRRNDPVLWIAAVLLVAVAGIALVSPFIFDPDYTRIGLGERKDSPSLDHLFGTDKVGRDMFARTMMGFNAAMTLALNSLALGFVPGIAVSAAVGRAGRLPTRIVTSTSEIWLAVPPILIFIAILRRDSNESVLIAASITAFAAGLALAGPFRRAFTEHSPAQEWRVRGPRVLASVAPVAVATASTVAASIILSDAMLGFLGFGRPEPGPSWGLDMGSARNSVPWAYHWMAFPAAALFITLFALNLFAAALRASAVSETELADGET